MGGNSRKPSKKEFFDEAMPPFKPLKPENRITKISGSTQSHSKPFTGLKPRLELDDVYAFCDWCATPCFKPRGQQSPSSTMLGIRKWAVQECVQACQCRPNMASASRICDTIQVLILVLNELCALIHMSICTSTRARKGPIYFFRYSSLSSW